MAVSFSRETNRYRKSTHQKYKHRTCQFRGCEETFMGHESHKYCHEHRKPEYKQDKYYYISTPEDTNMVYDHKLIIATRMKFNCACCNEEYEVVILPRIKVYPRYCLEHRNEFKRKLYEEGQR